MYEMVDLVKEELSIIRKMAYRLKVDIVSIDPETANGAYPLAKAQGALDQIISLERLVRGYVCDAMGEEDD